MKYGIITFSVCLSFSLFSCHKKVISDVDNNHEPLVSVNKRTLYRSDVKNALPTGIKGQDSMAISQAYIKSWIEDILLYDKAKQNILDQEQIDALVDDYKKSLIMHSYQDRLLKEHISENVPSKELYSFYEKNKEQFKLKENIIKGLYLKIPKNSPELNNFRKWYTRSTDEAIGNIEKKQLQNAVAYDFFYDKWVNLDIILENIPYRITDEGQFLKTKKYLEAQDSSFVYLLNIKEFKLKGEQAPIEYEMNRLKESYIKKREAELLHQIREDLYNKALSDKEIIFYNK